MAEKKNTKKAAAKTKKNTAQTKEKKMSKNTKKAEETKAPKKETKKQTTEVKKEAKEQNFAAFCGSTYDPDKSSECNLSCKEDMPEEFQKCLEHFKLHGDPEKNKAVRKATKKATKPKDFLGYRKGTRASGINQMLKEGFTLDEMTDAFNSTDNATRTHMYVVKKKHGLDIFKIPGSEKYIYNDGSMIADNVPIGCVDNEKAVGKEVKPKTAEEFKMTPILKKMQNRFQKLMNS